MVRKIESLEDEMKGNVTYDLGDGRHIYVKAWEVRRYGLEAVLSKYDVELPTGRLPVFQRGREIGSLPELFEPAAMKPNSILYDVRPGDFRRTDAGWEASCTLGPGDFEAVPGFEWTDREEGIAP